MDQPSYLNYYFYFLIFFNVFYIILFVLKKNYNFLSKLSFLSFILVSILWILRFIQSGHFPFLGAYESSITLIFITGIVIFIFSLRENFNLFLLYPFLSLILLFHSNFYSKKIWALTISEKSFWVHMHSIFAYLAFGLNFLLLTVSFFKLKNIKTKFSSLNLLLFFFFFYSFMFFLGIFYRFLLFGKPFSFDPMETIHLSIFFIYTTFIHISYFNKWDEKRISKIAIILFFLFLISYRIILFFPPSSTYHIIDIDLRLHIKPL